MSITRAMDSTEDYFSKLPPELKITIFNNLGIFDIRNSRRVCKEWMQILNEFVRMRVRLTDDTVEYVKNCSAVRVDCLNIKNFQKNVTLSTSRKMVIPEAKTIVIDTGNSNANLTNIWRYSFEGAKTLHLHNSSLVQISETNMAAVIPFVNWPALVELRVRVIIEVPRPTGMWDSETSRRHLMALIEFFKGLNVPCLKNVNIHAEAGVLDTGRFPLSDFYAQLLPFLVRHKNTLVGLNMFARGKFYDGYLNGINLSGQDLMHLERLSLDFDVHHAQLCLNIASAGNNLKTLVLDKELFAERGDIEVHVNFKDVIQKNRRTLETITIKKMSLDCGWFDGCESLKSFELLFWNPTNMKNCGILPTLRELDIDGYVIKSWTTQCVEKPEILRDQLLDWIGNCMINLEILRLEFNFGLKFTVEHYDSLMRRLPKLRMLSLTRIEAKAFEKLERENPPDSLIRINVILVVPRATHIPYHIFQMKRIRIGQKSNFDKFRA